MSPVRFEPTISAGERPKTYVLDRAATGSGGNVVSAHYCVSNVTLWPFFHLPKHYSALARRSYIGWDIL